MTRMRPQAAHRGLSHPIPASCPPFGPPGAGHTAAPVLTTLPADATGLLQSTVAEPDAGPGHENQGADQDAA